MKEVLYVRVARPIKARLDQVADAAGLSTAQVTEIMLGAQLGIPHPLEESIKKVLELTKPKTEGRQPR